MYPKARQAIKYLVSDGRYDYIETGSLLSIRKNVQSIVIPSEETRLSMYPLDFEEFLHAVGEEMKWDLIRYSFDKMKPVGDALHRYLMRHFRLYMAVGGMPQAINKYLDSNNLMEVDEVKHEILDLYLEDLRKVDAAGKASLIFSSIPSQLGERSGRRYKIGSVLPNVRPSEASELITDLADSMMVNVSYRASDPSVGLAMHKDPTDFRLFLSDTGLLVTLAFMDSSVIENTLYNKLLSDKLSVDLGYVYENVVAQLLLASGKSLYYYTFRNEGARHPYEIDFLTVRDTKLVPIEVKSSSYMAHKSLDQFIERYPSRISSSYLLSPKDIRRDGPVLGLPVYMTGLL